MCAKKKREGFAAEFDVLQKVIRRQAQSFSTTQLIREISINSLSYLDSKALWLDLSTKIPEKSYYSFQTREGKSKSRAVRRDLFADTKVVGDFFEAVDGGAIRELSASVITRACYTIVMSFACAIDLDNPGDKKTPGTFYEYVVTHLLARYLACDPSERVAVPVGLDDDKVNLTMDLLLNAPKGARFHIAIKNSTRERASEIWTHQRILDEAFGKGSFIGLFVGLSETKLDHQTNEVVEICVPDQWRAYQRYIAQLAGVYYLDPPQAYLQLNNKNPKINVRQFGEIFFDEPIRAGFL